MTPNWFVDFLFYCWALTVAGTVAVAAATVAREVIDRLRQRRESEENGPKAQD